MVNFNIMDSKDMFCILDDHLLWCDDCQQAVSGLSCPLHNEIETVQDCEIPPRAKLTLPQLLAVRVIDMTNGVFAKSIIQRRTRFGPFQGELVDAFTPKHKDQLVLKLFGLDDSVRYFNTADTSRCNWMMYVRTARNKSEQNLIIYQHKQALYFVTNKNIGQNEELRAGYAASYERALKSSVVKLKRHENFEDLANMASGPLDEAFCGEGSERKDHEDTFEDAWNENYASLFKKPTLEGQALQDDNKIANSLSKDAYSLELGVASSCKLPNLKSSGNEADCDESSVGDCKGVMQGSCKGVKSESENLCRCEADDQISSVRNENSCFDCSEKFDSPNQLLTHKCGKPGRRRRKSQPYKLNAKRGRFITLPVIDEEPLKPKRSKALLDCEVCKLTFLSKSKLKQHMWEHSGMQQFVCTKCSKSFSNSFKLKRHQVVHSEERNFQCAYCCKEFRRRDHLNNHIRVHDPNKTTHECQECGKKYSSSYAYRTHLALHSMEKGGLSCLVCNKEFLNSVSLSEHLRFHSSARSPGLKKSLECFHCGKLFFSRRDLQRHSIVHTKDRDFLCQFCPRRFGRSDHLIRHFRKSHSTDSLKDAECSLPDQSISDEAKTDKFSNLPESSEVTAMLDISNDMSNGVDTFEVDDINRLDDINSKTSLDITKYGISSPSNSELLSGILTDGRKTSLPNSTLIQDHQSFDFSDTDNVALNQPALLSTSCSSDLNLDHTNVFANSTTVSITNQSTVFTSPSIDSSSQAGDHSAIIAHIVLNNSDSAKSPQLVQTMPVSEACLNNTGPLVTVAYPSTFIQSQQNFAPTNSISAQSSTQPVQLLFNYADTSSSKVMLQTFPSDVGQSVLYNVGENLLM